MERLHTSVRRTYQTHAALDGAPCSALTTVEVPSLNAYVNDPHSRHIPNDRLPIPYVYVQVTPEAQDAILSASPNTTVSVAPDHNVWVDVYGSWQYQLLLRWVPAMIFTMSGCMAALFLFQHMRIVVGATEPNARRRWRTLCRSIASRLSLPHFTLALEISTTFPLVPTTCWIVPPPHSPPTVTNRPSRAPSAGFTRPATFPGRSRTSS